MGTTNIALERVQALLKIDAGDGSLYDHLLRVVRKLAEEKPADALEHLETLSTHLKSATFRPPASEDACKPIVPDKEAIQLRDAWCAAMLQMVRQPSDLAPKKALLNVQNFMEDAQMFAWAGVGFGKQESYYLTMALRKLAVTYPDLEEIRLWGKIMGTESDYLVAEGTPRRHDVKDAPDPPPPVLPGMPEYDVEPRGSGPNTNLYWVTSGYSAPWVPLPAARASHICAARSIKKLLTGNLDAPVYSAPWFPGRERDLLRAQIARITASTKLAPSGVYSVDANIPNMIQLKDEMKDDILKNFPSPEGMTWEHAAPYLLKTGRSSYPDVDDLDDADERKTEILEQKKLEDEHELLEGIEKDLAEGDPQDPPIAWSVKELYPFDGSSLEGQRNYRVNAAKSLIWPGAVAVAQSGKFANLYVGYALKCGDLVPVPLANTSPFSPLFPEDIEEEPQSEEEQEEPRPTDKEDDSDGGSADGLDPE